MVPTKIVKWQYYNEMHFFNDYLKVDRPRISSVMDEKLDNKNIRLQDSKEVVQVNGTGNLIEPE